MAALLVASTAAYAQKDKGHSSSSHSSPPARQSAPARQAPPAQHQSAPVQSHSEPAHQAAPQASTPHVATPPSGDQGRRYGGFGSTGATHNAQPGGQTQSQPQVNHSAQPSGQPQGQSGRQFGQPAGGNSGQQQQQGNRGMSNSGQGVHTAQPNNNGGGFGNRGNGATPNNASRPNGFGGNPNGGNAGNNGARFGSNGGGNRPGGASVTQTRNGGSVIRSSSGNVREVHTAGGAVIHHAPDGGRRIEVSRPGGRVVVASAHGGTGYVQRPLVVNNHTYVQRTYVYHGTSYARVYRPWVYGGVTFHVYTPYRYYHPGFYSYVYNPWARPVYYSWGWGASPWYGYYGGWFTPYPVYASPSLWLTDYLIARTLEDAYQSRADAAAAAQAQNYGATPLTPEVKQQIADEVRRQIEQEKAEQGNPNSTQGGAPPMFSSNGPQVFVVSTALLVQSQGGECPVTEGDVLQMNGPPPQGAQTANLTVLASKGRDCRKGMMVSVGLNDLQEMQNQMRATIDQGLGDLQSKQGQGGLPTLPPAAAAPPENAFGNQIQPDANAATELTQAATEADRAEQDVVNQSLDNSGGPPPTVSLGMTTNEVESILGAPKNVANVGAKKIYVYRDMKIIFIDGKVSDVQ